MCVYVCVDGCVKYRDAGMLYIICKYDSVSDSCYLGKAMILTDLFKIGHLVIGIDWVR